jgi:hypothetical protein
VAWADGSVGPAHLEPAREPTISPTLWLADKFFRFRFKRKFRKNPDVLQLRPMLKRMAKSMPVPKWIAVTELGGVAGDELTSSWAVSRRRIG